MKTPFNKTCFLALAPAFLGLVLSGCPKDSDSETEPSKTPVSTCKQKDTRKLLVVHSYHPEYEWVQAITRGIRMEVDTYEVDLQCFYMDTKRHPSPAWAKQKAQEAMEVIGQWMPEAVITVDDNALHYTGQLLIESGVTPVVFCGINSDPAQYGYPAPNLTGVIERPHFKESVQLLGKITSKPGPVRIVVLSDSSETSRFTLDYMKTQVDSSIEVLDWIMPDTQEQWKKAVLEYQHVDAIAVYLYHTVLQSQDSQTVCEPRELMDWTVSHSTVPIIGFLTFAVDDGSLCGVLESGVEQGCLAGQYVEKILDGQEPASLKVVLGHKGQSMLNLNTARKLNLTISPEITAGIDIVVGRELQNKNN